MSHEDDVGDVRYSRMHVGTVDDRSDPENLSRVKVRVPGFVEPSGWAFPLGAPGGGGARRGFKWTPPFGAEVALFFRNGDPHAPYYLPAHWGKPGGITEIPGGVGDPDIHVMEFGAYMVTIDDRPGYENFMIKDKNSGDFLEFDGSKTTGPGMQIRATAGLVIQCIGLFSVEAARIVLNGRTVSDGPQTI